jgi:hypothetical protein
VTLEIEELGFLIRRASKTLEIVEAKFPDLSKIGDCPELRSHHIALQQSMRPLITLIEESRDFIFDNQTPEKRQLMSIQAIEAVTYAAVSEFEDIPVGMSLETLHGSVAVNRMCELIDQQLS